VTDPEARRNFTITAFNRGNPEESEDCLYLNVYAPSTPTSGAGRAVLYWIYGGSLQFGTAGTFVYNGSFFAAYEDVIVVTVNYRTNVFGFANSPELPRTGQNLGFLDQRAGLDWVQRNIAAFGGDPDKVTIFGESAGGFSVDALLTSSEPDEETPFRAAIVQSGQISFRAGRPPVPYRSWYALTAALNCTGRSNLTCVRAADATTIKDIIERQALSFNPIADNTTLVSDPIARRRDGRIKKIPTMSGTVAEESRVFQLGTTNLTAFLQASFGNFPQLWPILSQAYNTSSSGAGDYDIASAIATDFTFQCLTALYANATATAGIPTWRYYFNASFPNTQVFPGLGVFHASEIPIIFYTFPTENMTIQQEVLGNYMRGAWADFAKNPEKGPGWVAVGAAGQYAGAEEDQDLAVLGDVRDVIGGGATVVRQSEIDRRCAIFRPVYEALGIYR
jgi:acetylcholinesterase